MDNLTHSLFGLTLARSPMGRAGRGVTVALLIASNAPDVDAVTLAGGTATYLQWHRGPTHGPFGIIVLGLLSAVLARFIARRRGEASDPPASLGRLWAMSMLGVLFHILMDLPTSYGTRLLSPFSWSWFTTDWMPIIDVYLLAILAMGLWAARSQPTRSALIALTLVAANYGVRAVAHHDALVQARAQVGTFFPPACDNRSVGAELAAWPVAVAPAPRDLAAARCVMDVAAVPDFTSPFHWRLITQLSNGYDLRDIDLLDGQLSATATGEDAPRMSVRYPNQWTPAVVRAAASPIAQTFLGFSRFPAARSVLGTDDSTTVRWTDVRFVQGSLVDSSSRGNAMFTATVRVSADGAISEQRLGP